MVDSPRSYDPPSLLETARTSPAETALFSVLPLAIAAAQLGIGAATDLHLGVATAFAAVMVGYAVLATRYNRTLVRLDALE